MNPYRILLIEPDQTSANYLSNAFAKEGFEVYSASTTIDGLLQAYQQRPHVIVIDPVFPLNQLQELIAKSRKDWRLSRSAIIAFSSLTDPSKIQQVIDLGFDQIIPKESHSLTKLLTLCEESAEKARFKSTHNGSQKSPKKIELDAAPQPSDDGKIIVFLATKGGVGTTSLCANIAHITSKLSNDAVAVVDLVLPIGSLDSIVGTHNSGNIVDISQHSQQAYTLDQIKESLEKPRNWDFNILSGSNSPDQSEKLDISRVPLMIDALKKIFDYTFVDIGKSLSGVTLPIILSADMIVLTLSLDKTTVEQTKTIWEFLQKKGVIPSQVYFLINRAVSLEGINKSEVEEILGTVIQLAIPHMGRNFTLANNLNQPLFEKFPQDAVTLSLRQASEEIIQKIKTNTGSISYF